MYFLALFFYAVACLGIKILKNNRGEYVIPDFIQSGYSEGILVKFKETPRRVVKKHYYLDAYYILFYALASITISLASHNVPVVIRWVPAISGVATAVLDFLENHILKNYYYDLHRSWMTKIVSRVTRVKAAFAWGWFITVPLYLLWALLRWLF